MKTALFPTVANCSAALIHIYIYTCTLLKNSFFPENLKNHSKQFNIVYNLGLYLAVRTHSNQQAKLIKFFTNPYFP